MDADSNLDASGQISGEAWAVDSKFNNTMPALDEVSDLDDNGDNVPLFDGMSESDRLFFVNKTGFWNQKK